MYMITVPTMAPLDNGHKLSEKVNEAENKPYKQIASNVNSIKVAVITCICTLLVSGIIGAIVMFGK